MSPGGDPHSTHSSVTLKLLLDRAAKAGIDTAEVLTSVGLEPGVLDDVDARVPSPIVHQLWDELAERSEDPEFGLTLGQSTPVGSIGLIDYISRNCKTLKDALGAMARYVRLVNDGAEISFEQAGNRVILSHRLVDTPDQSPWHLGDWVVSLWYSRAREYTGLPFSPLEVHFQHPAPRDARAYLKLFGCPVRFSAPANTMILEAYILDLPLRQADPGLSAILTSYADELMQRLPQRDQFAGQLRRHILDALPNGEPRIADVARHLGLSARTLQRRLKSEGTTFHELVGELRHELAARYLSQQDMAIGEIAFMLGFSEPSAFHRSFKRWKGQTPAEFRQQAIAS